MKTLSRHLWTGLFLGVFAQFCAAGTSTGLVTVHITLNNPNSIPAPPVAGGGTSTASDVCISKSLSEQANALVQVVCSTGQFVSISPVPGKPFLGTHGGAFRYDFVGDRLSGAGPLDAGNPYIGTGTVTALRIYNANGSDGPLEMLVSF
ncbi:MAG: hypothetical protein V4455_17720 [Pseudomonadota bacterium]